MTRIATTYYRYKRTPGKRKPVAFEVPAVVKAKRSRRPIGVKAAAEIPRHAPVFRRKGAAQPSTPHDAARVAPQRAAKAAILTIRRQGARIIPPGLLAETPEEHRRRGDAADAMWRELVRRVAAAKR
jgi:hypothetical protein